MSQTNPENLPVPMLFPQDVKILGDIQIITASDELFNHVDENKFMWSGDGDRTLTADIQFAKAFREVPTVTLGLVGMDSDHSQNLRFWLNAINISTSGLTVEFKTWGATHIARAGVSWQAIGLVKPNPVEAKDKAMGLQKGQKS